MGIPFLGVKQAGHECGHSVLRLRQSGAIRLTCCIPSWWEQEQLLQSHGLHISIEITLNSHFSKSLIMYSLHHDKVHSEAKSTQLCGSSAKAENNSDQICLTHLSFIAKIQHELHFTWSSDHTHVLKAGALCIELINDRKYDLNKTWTYVCLHACHEGIKGSGGKAALICNLITRWS
jgi:hypothetical protein